MELAPICRREYTPEGAAIYRDRGAGPKVRIRLPPAENPRNISPSAFAVEVFCYRVAGHIASLAAPLGGLDGIVFAAGVGENAVPVRSAICRECSWLGLELDEAANREHRERISAEQPRRRVCDKKPTRT
jgi:acetate kinase